MRIARSPAITRTSGCTAHTQSELLSSILWMIRAARASMWSWTPAPSIGRYSSLVILV